VHSLTKKFWNLFRKPQNQTIRRSRSVMPRRVRPCIEALEDRLTPATAGFSSTAPAVLSGFVYDDANGNGVFDPGELPIPGVSVTLQGTTAQGAPVSIATTTDGNGQYIFYQVSPGTYTLTRGPLTNLVDGPASFGNLGGTTGIDAISSMFVAQGQTAINNNFAVEGLASSAISARLFMNTTTTATLDIFLPSPGAGFTAADGTVQPTAAPVAGTSSLSGTVDNTSTGAGLQGAELALTGIDTTGRAILLTATTDANGNYSFNNLQAGTYNLNVVEQPDGFRLDLPTAGIAGGNIFQNGQVLNIQVAAAQNATGYNFGELPVAGPAASVGVTITAALADDTAGPGGTTSDAITSDPTIQGAIVSSSPIVSFQAGFDNTPAADFTNILGNLNPSGSFLLNPLLLALIFGGVLPQGSHTLHLTATNSAGQSNSFDIAFTLDSVAPTVPTLHLDAAADPNGTGTTTDSSVSLEGTTSPNVQVQLLQGNTVVGTQESDASGNFTFSGITLQSGANDYTVQATDIAGNTSQLQTYFLLDSGPVAVPTGNVSESLTQGATDTFVDLSSPTLFTDPGFSDSLIRLNTSAGPINLELFDTQAPQTVANFFDYIDQGDYNNDIFERLATAFVLQGGGFTFNPGSSTITQETPGPTIPDEFSASNPDVEGTIAMAMTSNPNSATNEFFFNLVDNTTTLGSSNDGGFAVFGKLVSGADQRVLNTLTAATVVDESSFNSAFNTLPLNNYTGTNFPSDSTAANYDLINSVTVVQQTQQLTYSIVSNSDTTGSIVKASITFGQLDLDPVGPGTATIEVKATDKAGDSATVTFSVNVTGIVSVTSPGNQSGVEGSTVTGLQINATDSNGSTLTYSATGLPPGLSINQASGAISGTIDVGDSANSPYNPVITVTDASNFSATTTFQWTVTPVVTITTPTSPQQNVEGDNVSLQIVGADADSLALTYSDNGTLPPGLIISSSGLITGVVSTGDSSNSPFNVTITATDSSGNTNTTSFQWKIYATDPVSVSNPGTQSNLEGDLVDVAVNATDITGGTPTFTATGLPPGISIDPTSGHIVGTINTGDSTNSPYNATVTVTDGAFSAQTTFQWNVSPVVTVQAPNPLPQNTEGDMVNLQIQATDAHSLPLTFIANGTLPAGLSISSSGLITGQVSVGDSSGNPYTVIITATDSNNASGQVNFLWTITA
jgi:cyclophilin family peptidyl-prolyl cis-trans isomerase